MLSHHTLSPRDCYGDYQNPGIWSTIYGTCLSSYLDRMPLYEVPKYMSRSVAAFRQAPSVFISNVSPDSPFEQATWNLQVGFAYNTSYAARCVFVIKETRATPAFSRDLKYCYQIPGDASDSVSSVDSRDKVTAVCSEIQMPCSSEYY